MSDTPADLKYTKSHEWVRMEDDGNVTIGITDHAQAQLGDMVFIELPESGRSLAANEEIGVVESVKAASDIYSPISGEVVETNANLEDAPELVNNDAFGEGWMVRLKPSDTNELDQLLDAEAYAALAAED